MNSKVKKLALALVVLSTFGCAFGMQQIRKSESAFLFAQQKVLTIDAKKLMEKGGLPASEIESKGPLHLYNSGTASFSNDLITWSYVQSMKRKDGIECFLYLNFDKSSRESREFDVTSYSNLYCFPEGKDRLSIVVEEPN